MKNFLKEIDKVPSIQINNKPDTTKKYEENKKVYDIDTLKDEIIDMQNDFKRKIDIVRKQAYIDKLTSLKNRAAYMDTVNTIDRAIQDNIAFSVAIFDICGLKNINDDCGHEAGDIAIIDSANILKKVFGKDNIYRFGGDEFIGILDETSDIELNAMFDKLDKEINI